MPTPEQDGERHLKQAEKGGFAHADFMQASIEDTQIQPIDARTKRLNPIQSREYPC